MQTDVKQDYMDAFMPLMLTHFAFIMGIVGILEGWYIFFGLILIAILIYFQIFSILKRDYLKGDDNVN